MTHLNPQLIRRTILEQSIKSGLGHIGSALSVVDILVALYDGVLSSNHEAGQRAHHFVMSKGHAALALFAVLKAKGMIEADVLDTYGVDGTLLGVHPDHRLPGIDFTTGSLGHGLSYGVGVALGFRMKKEDKNVFVMMSDGEMNEGSVWESAMVGGHQGLSNLVAIVDVNGQQAYGYTKDVLRLDRLSDMWQACGWSVHHVDGHNVPLLREVFGEQAGCGESPHVILASTVFGRSVRFMENQIKWHYQSLSDSEYRLALAELEKEVG